MGPSFRPYVNTVMSAAIDRYEKVFIRIFKLKTIFFSNLFHDYYNHSFSTTFHRLGDTRETVREKAGFLVSKLLEEDVLEPQVLFEKNIAAFSHKNGKVREELLILLQNTLNM